MSRPDSRRPQAHPPLHLRRTARRPHGIRAVVRQGETDERMLPLYLINFSPEFQTPYLHFSSYRKGQFKMEFTKVC